MKRIYTGIESSGKSLQLSIEAERVLKRNIRWLAKTGVPRTMAFDSPMAADFVRRIEDAGLTYLKFTNLTDILHLTESDIFINELIKYFPANGSQPLSPEQVDFVTQGAKNGIHIYAASQDLSQVHKQFRLMVNEVIVCTKLLGSRRPMRSAPPVKWIWGLIMLRNVRPQSFKGDNATMDSVELIPSFTWIDREDCERFDTSYKVPAGELPPRYVRKQRLIGKTPDGEIEYEKVLWV